MSGIRIKDGLSIITGDPQGIIINCLAGSDTGETSISPGCAMTATWCDDDGGSEGGKEREMEVRPSPYVSFFVC